ncbi:MAG TPA: sigma-70 family RNA polymerase sigma factor [Solirubrobacteraceae bacterium]|nr:sigma-70 family RNA polymerase sigma factor [Solirubrobacteraceae bacterium]
MDNSRSTPQPSVLRTQGFDAFYREYHTEIEKYLRWRLRDEDMARELVAETFLIAFEHQDDFRGRLRPQEWGWLRAIARSQMLNCWQTRRTYRSALQRLDVPAPSADPALERIDEIDAAKRLVGKDLLEGLERRQRQVITMHIIDGHDFSTIGRMLGEQPGAVRMRFTRALRYLRFLLSNAKHAS